MGYLIQNGWLLVILAGLNSTMGNLLLKKSSDFVGMVMWSFIPCNIWFFLGLSFYGINVLLFAKALQTLGVATAYPVLAGVSFVFLSLASYLVFGEKLVIIQYVGIAVILFGIFLLTMAQ